jgi:hypothetical protein
MIKVSSTQSYSTFIFGVVLASAFTLTACGTDNRNSAANISSHTGDFSFTNFYATENIDCDSGDFAVGSRRMHIANDRALCATLQYRGSRVVRAAQETPTHGAYCPGDALATGFTTGGAYCAGATVTIDNFRYRLKFNPDDTFGVNDLSEDDNICPISEGSLMIGGMSGFGIFCASVYLSAM